METLGAWAGFWSRWVSAEFYKAYRHAAGTTVFLPVNETDLQTMMDVYLLRKAIYEVGNALNHRPDGITIHLQEILALIVRFSPICP